MSDYKIYVDAGRPATLNDGAGALTDCPTLQEAVLAWQRLAPEKKIRATVKVVFAPDIGQCHQVMLANAWRLGRCRLRAGKNAQRVRALQPVCFAEPRARFRQDRSGQSIDDWL